MTEAVAQPVREPLPPQDLDRLEALVRGEVTGRVRDLRLELHGEGLVLRGYARSYYAKQLAQTVVLEVLGKTLLVNEIEVQPVAPGLASGSEEVA